MPEPLACLSPPFVFAGVEGKYVLCLASGGGQQSAVFGLLGAKVTVVDLAEGQLRGDRRAAAHYGYEVAAFHADMRDLSCIGDGSIDLVYQAASLCYVPHVREVYAEVSRVLRNGGLYRAQHQQPAIHFVGSDGEGYRITKPYAERVLRREDGGIEFRHYMDDIFGGLVDAGLSLRQVVDVGRHREPDPRPSLEAGRTRTRTSAADSSSWQQKTQTCRVSKTRQVFQAGRHSPARLTVSRERRAHLTSRLVALVPTTCPRLLIALALL